MTHPPNASGRRAFIANECDTLSAARLLLREQQQAVCAIEAVVADLAKAAEVAAKRLRGGGRLIYVGAGTSARIAAQDAAELYPTFNWSSHRVKVLISGGEAALQTAVENAEDSWEAGRQSVCDAEVTAMDNLIAVSASATTPFVCAAAREAKARGALLIAISNHAPPPPRDNSPASQPDYPHRLSDLADIALNVPTGEEYPIGSTRMKAGTAQKVTLNLLSTLIMRRLGRVHNDLMVDVVANNAKLRARRLEIVAALAEVSHNRAAELLEQADGSIKVATIMAAGATKARAHQLLSAHDDHLAEALEALSAASNVR